jgi:hypothetical protein
MFILALIIAIVIGYIIKGKLSNLQYAEIKAIWLIFLSFFIEFVINMLISRDIITKGTLTLSLDLVMYLMIFAFTFINRKSKFLLIMGVGFLLNAIPIFANGGAMPVGVEAAKAVSLDLNVEKVGLYVLANSETRFAFLGDIIPVNFIVQQAASIGDFVAAAGLIGFIVVNMRKKS